MSEETRWRCTYCAAVFKGHEAPRDDEGPLCPGCGRGEDLEELPVYNNEIEAIIGNLKVVEEEISAVRRDLEVGCFKHGEVLCHASILLDNTYTMMASPMSKEVGKT